MGENFEQEQWNKKNVDLGGSILQSWNWGEIYQSLGHKIIYKQTDKFSYLGVEEDLPLGKKYFYCPRGPVGDAMLALDELEGLKKDKNLIFVRVEPQTEVNLPKALKEVQPSHTWVTDLSSGTEEELLLKMKPKTRYNINLAQRRKVIVRLGEKMDLLEFWKLMLETSKRSGFRLHPQSYYWAIWEKLSSKYLKLFIAEYNYRILAASLVTTYGDTAVFLHGGSSEQNKDVMAPYLLHWEAMRQAKIDGIKYYDFGGIAPEGASNSHPWSGITRFKKGFGGFEVNYPGTYDLVFSPIWYNVYKNARKLKKVFSVK
jgi:lipid II:glycine glycyltransferase (peptidoglycan interpeptide bridge formation enzyme)